MPLTPASSISQLLSFPLSWENQLGHHVKKKRSLRLFRLSRPFLSLFALLSLKGLLWNPNLPSSSVLITSLPLDYSLKSQAGLYSFRSPFFNSYMPADKSTSGRRVLQPACDACHIRRVKCSHDQPCAHCTRLGLTCTYTKASSAKVRGLRPGR